jgi:hypothetical protein
VARVLDEMMGSTIVQGFVRHPPQTDGKNTEQIMTTAKRSDAFRVPDETQIGAIFLYSFHIKKDIYEKHFRSVSAKVLTLDHTFRSR